VPFLAKSRGQWGRVSIRTRQTLSIGWSDMCSLFSHMDDMNGRGGTPLHAAYQCVYFKKQKDCGVKETARLGLMIA
jgi:hypothetical protein